MIAALLACLLTAPPAATPEDHLEQALRCLRKGDRACVISEAQAAVDAPDLAVRREARAALAQALAESDRAADAEAAFARLLEVYPAWAPPPDADPRVVAAVAAARAARLRDALPKTLDPGPAPELHLTPDELAPLLPAPRLYAPDVAGGPPRFALSIGAGVGIPSGDRYVPGLHAAIDFRWLAGQHLAFWTQATLALLPLDDALPVEPGRSRGLTAFTVAFGVEARVPIIADVEAYAAAGVGIGGFGLAKVDEALGPALAFAVGVRWQANENLALRGDVAPVFVFPANADGVGVGGHIAILLRGEARF